MVSTISDLGPHDTIQLSERWRDDVWRAAGRCERQELSSRDGVAVPLPQDRSLAQHHVIAWNQVPAHTYSPLEVPMRALLRTADMVGVVIKLRLAGSSPVMGKKQHRLH